MTEIPSATPGSDRDAAANELSYEAARDELIDVVRKLEAGGASLAESMQLWERGEKLAEICQRWLDGARSRIDDARQTSRDQQTGQEQPARPHQD